MGRIEHMVRCLCTDLRRLPRMHACMQDCEFKRWGASRTKATMKSSACIYQAVLFGIVYACSRADCVLCFPWARLTPRKPIQRITIRMTRSSPHPTETQNVRRHPAEIVKQHLSMSSKLRPSDLAWKSPIHHRPALPIGDLYVLTVGSRGLI